MNRIRTVLVAMSVVAVLIPGTSAAAVATPRLLFTREQLPHVRQLAQTTQGKIIVEKLKVTSTGSYSQADNAMSSAFLFLLTGDSAYLKSARVFLTQDVLERGGEFGAVCNAKRVTMGALVFDMLYEYLPEWDRRALIDIFKPWINPGRLPSNLDKADAHVGAQFLAAAGMAALAVMGMPEQMRAFPKDPSQARVIPAPTDYTVPAGVPVVPFTSDVMPTQWLRCGPFASSSPADDPLSTIGGKAMARPSAGTVVTADTHTSTFVLDTNTWQKYGRSWMNLPGTIAPQRAFDFYGVRKANGTYLGQHPSELNNLYFYTVIENDTTRTIVAKPNSGGQMFAGTMWISGVELHEGDVAKLEKGRYPVMVEIPLIGMWAAPRIAEYGDYAAMLTQWRADSAAYGGNGGNDPLVTDGLDKVRRGLMSWLRLCVGEHGFPNENMGTGEVWEVLMPFLYVHKLRTGIDLHTGQNASPEWVLPLAMMTHLRYPHFTTTDAGELAFWRALGFPGLIDKAFLAPLRWNIDNSAYTVSRNANYVYLLLNYPYDTPAVSPAESNLPLFVYDRKFSNCVFRSGWNDSADFAAMFSVVARPPRSCVTATDFTIFGLGEQKPWSGYGPSPVGIWVAPQLHTTNMPNVVRFDTLVPVSGGKILSLSSADDGSGMVSMHVDHFVKGRSHEGPDEAFRDGPIVIDKDSTNVGINVFRAFAADFSGASGAPGLFAVVDRIRGAGSRDYWLQYNCHDKQITVSGNTFTLKGSTGATMKGTFVAPATVTMKVSGRILEIRGSANDYLLILTGQKGTPPPVQVTGQGLSATATIGSQTVSFDTVTSRMVLTAYTGKAVNTGVATPHPKTRPAQTAGARAAAYFDLTGRRIGTGRAPVPLSHRSKVVGGVYVCRDKGRRLTLRF